MEEENRPANRTFVVKLPHGFGDLAEVTIRDFEGNVATADVAYIPTIEEYQKLQQVIKGRNNNKDQIENMEKIICPKCGSRRIAHFPKEPPEEPEPVTMDEYAEESNFGMTYAIMRYTEMVLLCKDCGYRREYTSPRTGTTGGDISSKTAIPQERISKCFTINKDN